MEMNKTTTVSYRPVIDKNQFDNMRALCVKIKYQTINEVDGRICAEIDNMRKLFNAAVEEAFYKGVEIGKEDNCK